MVESGQQVGFAFEVLHDGFTHKGVRSRVDHFLDRHQLGHIGEVHITGAIDRPHAPYSDHFLNRIAIGKCETCLKLARSAGIITSIVGQVREYARFQ